MLLDVLPIRTLGCTLSLSRVTKHNCQGIDIARLFRLAESYCAYRKSHLWAEAVAHKAANQNVRTHTSPRNNREAREIGDSHARRKIILVANHVELGAASLLNNFRVGRFATNMYNGQDKTAATNVAATEFGIKTVNPEAFAYGPPGISISTFQRAGVPDWQPTGADDSNLQFNEQFTWTKGRHTMKFGTDLRLLNWFDLGWAIQNGTYTFNGQYTSNPFADYLLGMPSFAQVALRGEGKYSYTLKQGEFSFYGQDDFKVNSQLTLNYGLRYELVQFPLEENDQLTNWDFKNHTMLFAGKDLPRRLLPTPKKNFSPRLGVAYNPSWSRKTVFRGGFGLMYGNYRQYEAALQHFHPPYVNENFIYNDVPLPTFTMANIWPPVVTDFKNGDLSGTTVNYLANKAVPKSYQWNFNIQHELPGDFLFQVGYVANLGREMQIRYDANQAVQMDPLHPSAIQDRRPYQRLGFVSANSSDGYSSYHGLDVHVERRYKNGFSLIGSYTFMKEFGIRTVDNYTVMMINNLRHSYGAEGYPQRAIVSYVYELPFGKGKQFLNSLNPVVDRVIGGWQINGITTLRSGNFLSVDSNVNNGAGSRAQKPRGRYRVAGGDPHRPTHSRAVVQPGCFRGSAIYPLRNLRRRRLSRSGLGELRPVVVQEHPHRGNQDAAVPRGSVQRLQQSEPEQSQHERERPSPPSHHHGCGLGPNYATRIEAHFLI